MQDPRKSVFISTIFIIVLIFTIPWFIIAQFNFAPPPPKIVYSEFPFKLTYELDGEIRIIEDTIICEFEGFEWKGENGKYRKWKSYLKSGSNMIILLDLNGSNEKNEFGHTILRLFFDWGNAEYYMGDNMYGRGKNPQSFDWIDYQYQTMEGKIGGSGYRAEEAFEKYKIRLISWECAPPIENKFE